MHGPGQVNGGRVQKTGKNKNYIAGAENGKQSSGFINAPEGEQGKQQRV